MGSVVSFDDAGESQRVHSNRQHHSVRVLFTVPHAACVPGAEGHTCDTAAEFWARRFAQDVPDSAVLTAQVPRAEQDQNRPYEGRPTTFRAQIDALVRENLVDLVLDVHSFPAKRATHRNDVYLLEPVPECHRSAAARSRVGGWTRSAHSLVRLLRRAGFAAGVFRSGSCLNDIVVSARNAGVQAHLLEVSEDLPKARAAAVSQTLRIWLATSFGPSTTTPARLVAPTSGVVEEVSPEIEGPGGLVAIYIAPEDDHTIYAPLGGIVRRIWSERGRFVAEALTVVYEAPVTKTEQLHFEIGDDETLIKFYVEVGKPHYVTDSVALLVEPGWRVDMGQPIGEILLGSRAVIYVPNAQALRVQIGDRLIGGTTVLI